MALMAAYDTSSVDKGHGNATVARVMLRYHPANIQPDSLFTPPETNRTQAKGGGIVQPISSP